jgi:hypothetical protein
MLLVFPVEIGRLVFASAYPIVCQSNRRCRANMHACLRFFVFAGLQPQDHDSKWKSLVVEGARLASPKHHGKAADKRDTKPCTVERYPRTIGGVRRCVMGRHPSGGFVFFPAPATAGKDFARLPGNSCWTLLYPTRFGDFEASRRLEICYCLYR